MRQWTQESALLSTVILELRQLRAVLIGVNLPAGRQPPRIEPVPTPETAYSRLASVTRIDKKLAVHDMLVGKLLGDRAKK